MSQLSGRFIGALLGILVIATLIIMMFGLIGTIVYGFGWSVGWIIHIFVGPDMIFGVGFEQLIGICWVVSSIMFFSISNALKSNTAQLVEQFKNIAKKYRG